MIAGPIPCLIVATWPSGSVDGAPFGPSTTSGSRPRSEARVRDSGVRRIVTSRDLRQHRVGFFVLNQLVRRRIAQIHGQRPHVEHQQAIQNVGGAGRMSPRAKRDGPSLFAAAGLERGAPRPLADKLRPMRLAEEYLTHAHDHPVYQEMLTVRGVKFQYPLSSLIFTRHLTDSWLNVISWFSIVIVIG